MRKIWRGSLLALALGGASLLAMPTQAAGVQAHL